MCFVATYRNDAEAKNFGHDLRRLARAVHAMVCELIGRKTLRKERPETGLVPKEGPAAHRHATGKQNLNGGIKPNHRNASRVEKLRATGLRVRATAESKHQRFPGFTGAAKSSTKLIGFHLPESRLAEMLEHLGYTQTGGLLDAIIKIHKAPCELAGQ